MSIRETVQVGSPPRRGPAGFTTVELLVAVAVMLALIGAGTLGVISVVESARSETALDQISAAFKFTRQAALTTNRERRLVIRVTYPKVNTLRDAYEIGVRTDFWIEEKLRRAEETWQRNFSEPLNDIQSLPAGVILTDINGRSLIPASANGAIRPIGKLETIGSDPSYRYWVSIVFNSRGRVTSILRESQRTDPSGDFQPPEIPLGNLAFHFLVRGTLIDMTESEPPLDSIDYLQTLSGENFTDDPDPLLVALESQVDWRFRGRPQCQTLYLISLTGMTVRYTYGIFPPWPNTTLPLSIEEAT